MPSTIEFKVQSETLPNAQLLKVMIISDIVLYSVLINGGTLQASIAQYGADLPGAITAKIWCEPSRPPLIRIFYHSLPSSLVREKKKKKWVLYFYIYEVSAVSRYG